MSRLNRWIQNSLLAVVMACSVTALFYSTPYAWSKLEILHIPVLFIIVFPFSIIIAEDVRTSFKKVFRYEQRRNKRSIWQVGVGMIFYFAQVGIVEVFFRSWMEAELGGMPLYLVISFLNAFLLTVIYEEIFYTEEINQPRTK
ncbi:DNA polymerase I [Ureibacillus sp. FSL K6-8385]|uniref:DNA polymerase I n=1 Tax=Ureibacillus terrenus TaxID=118246 RepID=A0A540V1I6_9BACL|nr:DNA polymerase I [Ureibacillus terrenus]MED3661958.1 DNA polymerase I [Ureibacillus terrenus]MED3764778.1 DNA polymerase I [Ureibacillus terrenus]TQE90588.1 DNA polymerase I [Ureibacillus terrenus]